MDVIVKPSYNNIDSYVEKKVNCFLLPIKDFSVESVNSFSIDEIKSIKNKYPNLSLFVSINKNIMNDDIKFATFIIKRFFSKRDSIQERNFYENYTNEMTLSEATNILNSIENTLEFEIYKIKHNKE